MGGANGISIHKALTGLDGAVPYKDETGTDISIHKALTGLDD